ncbi:MAG: hypothetical protein M5R36_29940 [Deltaproteobacteria bacterium]|nr:hypothetical protein [Deltaproteobacteria bacterium]
MNLFSAVAIVFALFCLAAFRVARPEWRHGLMTVAAALFITLQDAPHFLMRFFFIGLTFAIVLIGWQCGRVIAKQPAHRGMFRLGVTALLAPLVLFKIVQTILPPQLIENFITIRMGVADVGSLAPLGISYFTFRALAYLIEIRAGRPQPVSLSALLPLPRVLADVHGRPHRAARRVSSNKQTPRFNRPRTTCAKA